MGSKSTRHGARWTRRDAFLTAGAATIANLVPAAALAEPSSPPTNNIFTRIGVRPFINATAALTINSGLQTLPEVKKAMEEASYFSVNIDELMEKVGIRLAELMKCEAAMVSAGAAAALAHATAACVAGGDPEKIQQIPKLDGLRDEVVMDRQSRNQYDHAIRSIGVRIINIDSREEFLAALSKRTALVAVLGTAEQRGKVKLEEIVEAAHRVGAPVLVDAAPQLPVSPVPYLQRGADLVVYSGGKVISGPQCTGMLLGRKDLVKAAWLNSAPHHAFGRAMKVGKEEVMGLLAAVEALITRRDFAAERRNWHTWFAHIADRFKTIPGIKTSTREGGLNPHPSLEIEWDPALIGMNAGELRNLLLDGEPRIMSHAAGEGYSFRVRAAGMMGGDYKVVADRLYDIFRKAPKGKPAVPPAAPVVNVAGNWDLEIHFVSGSSRHRLFLETDKNRITGSHFGRVVSGDLTGEIDGSQVKLRSILPIEGTVLSYRFSGTVSGTTMSGEVDLGEYGSAKWTARRHRPEPRRQDPTAG